MLQYINAIDVHKYPTCSDFLSFSVGQKPLLLPSKKLRICRLGELPEYYKLAALSTHLTGSIYRKILCSSFDEKDLDGQCVTLNEDEIVFHRNSSINEKNIIDLIEYIERPRLTKEHSII